MRPGAWLGKGCSPFSSIVSSHVGITLHSVLVLAFLPQHRLSISEFDGCGGLAALYTFVVGSYLTRKRQMLSWQVVKVTRPFSLEVLSRHDTEVNARVEAAARAFGF